MKIRATSAMRWIGLAAALALSGCSLLQKAEAPAESPREAAREEAAAEVKAKTETEFKTITAQTPAIKAWRKIGAADIYKKYPKRIYKGKIPPLVYAVVVTETEIDSAGRVTGVHFSRTPSHAPEVSGKIAELIREASPFPSPGKLGAHTYVDTWLWDKSGQFQLDTLTLGQRSR